MIMVAVVILQPLCRALHILYFPDAGFATLPTPSLYWLPFFQSVCYLVASYHRCRYFCFLFPLLGTGPVVNQVCLKKSEL
jgi:hypothetical protein